MKDATQIGTSVEIENGLQALEIVSALVDRREREQEMDCASGVQAVDELLKQMDQTTAYSVLVSEEVDEEVQGR